MGSKASAFWLFRCDIQAYLGVGGDEATGGAKEQWEMGTDEIKLIIINYKKEAEELNKIGNKVTRILAILNRTPRVNDLTNDIREEYRLAGVNPPTNKIRGG